MREEERGILILKAFAHGKSRNGETNMNKYSEYIDKIMHEEGFVSYNTWQMGWSKFKKLMTDRFPDWRYNKRDLREAGYYLNTKYWKVMESNY